MRNSQEVIGVIPARLESKRLPGKVLLSIAGKAMVHRVYESARQSRLLSSLIVATDSEEVQRYCLGHDIPVTMTGRHPSGTDRLHEVMERTQGDEPMLRSDHIELLLEPILARRAEVTTLKVAMDDAEARDPNSVKVVTDDKGHALYFSRLPIPFDRSGSGGIRYYKHIGLYAYTRQALAQFHRLPQSSLELAEKLEQLRFLQNGIAILVAETPYDTIGVDTEADLERVIALFGG